MAEAFRTAQNTPNSKLMIIMNDNYADGRDVSWLWDTDFSTLENYDKNTKNYSLKNKILFCRGALRGYMVDMNIALILKV